MNITLDGASLVVTASLSRPSGSQNFCAYDYYHLLIPSKSRILSMFSSCSCDGLQRISPCSHLTDESGPLCDGVEQEYESI